MFFFCLIVFCVGFVVVFVLVFVLFVVVVGELNLYLLCYYDIDECLYFDFEE